MLDAKYLLGLTSFSIFALDLITKQLAANYLTESIQLLPFLKLELTKNPALAFGIPASLPIIVFFSILAIGLIGWFFAKQVNHESKLAVLAFSLVFGGAIGNLFERIFYGEVTDFIVLSIIPNFNLADSALTLGIFLLILFQKNIFRVESK